MQGPLGCEHCVLDGTILGQSSSLGMKGPTRHSYTEVEVMHRRRCTSNSIDVSKCLGLGLPPSLVPIMHEAKNTYYIPEMSTPILLGVAGGFCLHW